MYNKRSEKPQWAYELRICSSWLSSESIMCSGALCIKWRINKIDTKDNNNWNNNINSNNIFLMMHDLTLTLTDQMSFLKIIVRAKIFYLRLYWHPYDCKINTFLTLWANFTTSTQYYSDMNSQTPLIISFFTDLLKTASEVSVGMFSLITLFHITDPWYFIHFLPKFVLAIGIWR